VKNTEIVEIAGRLWVIEHVDLGGVTFFGCGILPLRLSRSDLIRDIGLAQGPEWRRDAKNGARDEP
jgi:hypothetical protein